MRRLITLLAATVAALIVVLTLATGATRASAATLYAKDQATLTAALTAAQAGDTIKVSGVVPAPRLTPKPGITFDMTDAVAVEWRLGSWRQVRFVGGVYRVTAAYRSAIEISGDDITFEGGRFEGPGVVDGVTPDGYGISFLGSLTTPVRNARVMGGEFVGLMAGVRASLVHGLAVESSTFTRIHADGISLSGVEDFRLIGNAFRDFRTGLKHADAIQANRPLNGVPVTRRGLLKGNRAEGNFQAWFVPDTEDVRLEGNWSKVTMATGIGVSGSKRAVLADNVMETLAPSDTISRVDDREAVDLKYEGTNIAVAYLGRGPIVYSQAAPAPTPLEAATARALTAEAALKASEAERLALAAQLAGANDNLTAANANLAAANAALAASADLAKALQAKVDAARAALN